jgi:hypothetical protein
VLARAEQLAKASAIGDAWRATIPELQDAQWLVDTLRSESEPPKRWPIIVTFLVTAIAMTVLLGTPHSISVLVRATTADIAFSLPARSRVSGELYLIPSEIPVSALAFSGTVTSLPAGALNSEGTIEASDWKNFRIEHVYLDAPPAQTPVVTLKAEAPNAVRLCVEGGDLYVDFAGTNVKGGQANDAETQVHIAGASNLKHPTQEKPQACVQWAGGASETVSLLANLPANDLHVSGSELVVPGENDHGDVFPVSLKSAQVTYPKAPGLKQAFERYERLGLKDFHGSLQSVSLSKGTLDVRAFGTVSRSMRSSGFAERDITPSRLALLRAQYGELWVAWGLLLYLVGLVTAFLKWRGVDV